MTPAQRSTARAELLAAAAVLAQLHAVIEAGRGAYDDLVWTTSVRDAARLTAAIDETLAAL
jgi:hypothetical protein